MTLRAVRLRPTVRFDLRDALFGVALQAETVRVRMQQRWGFGVVGVVTAEAAARGEGAVDVRLVEGQLVAAEAELVLRGDERVGRAGLMAGPAKLRGIGAVLGVAGPPPAGLG